MFPKFKPLRYEHKQNEHAEILETELGLRPEYKQKKRLEARPG